MSKYDLKPTDENLAELFELDLINRNEEIVNFIDLLNRPKECFVVALDGGWGSGKTTFVKLVQLILNQSNDIVSISGNSNYDRIMKKWFVLTSNKNGIITQPQYGIYYDAWENDNSSDSILSLLYETRQTGVKPDGATISKLKDLADSLLKILGKEKERALLNILEKQKGAVGQIETEESLYNLVSNYLKEIIPERADRVVIFVDELDRCKPSFAVDLLERIKHYFNNDKITFVFSVNIKELGHTISSYYGRDFDGASYLDKMFDLRVSLTKPADLTNYLKLFNFINGDALEHNSICLKTIEVLNFELREISRYLKLVRIALSRYSVQGYLNNANNYCHIIFGPILLGLKMKKPAEYEKCINGNNPSPLIDILLSLNNTFCLHALLNNNESYSNDSAEKVIVKREDKIKELYDVLFPVKDYRHRKLYEIGNFQFNGFEGEELIKTCNLMSSGVMYDIGF